MQGAEGQRLGLAGIGRHRRGGGSSRGGAAEPLRHRATGPPDPPSSRATEELRHGAPVSVCVSRERAG